MSDESQDVAETRRETTIHFRVSSEERSRIKHLASQHGKSTADYARLCALQVKAAEPAGASLVAVRAELIVLQQLSMQLKRELTEVRVSTAAVAEVVSLVKSTRRLAAAAMASLAHLRVEAHQSTVEAQATVKQHMDLSEATADTVVNYFANLRR